MTTRRTHPAFFTVTAKFGDEEQHYLLPLGVVWENQEAPVLARQLALANVRRGSRVGALTDAFAIPAFARILIDLLSRNATLSAGAGELHFRTEPKADLSGLVDTPLRWLSAEQSNSSLVYDDRAVLKLLRRPRAGIQPEIEMGRQLSRLGVTHVPQFLGEISLVQNDATTTIGILHAFVRNQGDAWQYTLDYLGRLIDDHVISTRPENAEAEIFTEYELFAAAIGRALGELHSALALPSVDPAFAPEAADQTDVEHWRDDTLQEIDRAYAMMDASTASTDAATQKLANKLFGYRRSLVDRVRALHHVGVTVKTRIHGDFHLGQLLVSSGDAIIVDFEGEPHGALEKRRAKSSPLRDVAGLLRSLHYAVASVGARDDARLTAPMRDARDQLLSRFLHASRGVFLAAYRSMLGDGAPINESLLDMFVIEKAAYELCYELANRPDWVHVPLRGLIETVEAGSA